MRTRKTSVIFRATDEELAYFNREYEKSLFSSRTDFILRLLDDKPVVVISELKQTLVELKRQGNNLNQIARQLNQGETVNHTLADVLKKCYEAYETLLEIGDDINASYGSKVKLGASGESH